MMFLGQTQTLEKHNLCPQAEKDLKALSDGSSLYMAEVLVFISLGLCLKFGHWSGNTNPPLVYFLCWED